MLSKTKIYQPDSKRWPKISLNSFLIRRENDLFLCFPNFMDAKDKPSIKSQFLCLGYDVFYLFNVSFIEVNLQ